MGNRPSRRLDSPRLDYAVTGSVSFESTSTASPRHSRYVVVLTPLNNSSDTETAEEVVRKRRKRRSQKKVWQRWSRLTSQIRTDAQLAGSFPLSPPEWKTIGYTPKTFSHDNVFKLEVRISKTVPYSLRNFATCQHKAKSLTASEWTRLFLWTVR